jgi:hypothetical protein
MMTRLIRVSIHQNVGDSQMESTANNFLRRNHQSGASGSQSITFKKKN